MPTRAVQSPPGVLAYCPSTRIKDIHPVRSEHCWATDSHSHLLVGQPSQKRQNHNIRACHLLTPPVENAGDTTLTGIQDNAGNYFVKVDRLYGNEVNEFTMVNVHKAFPANPPADTPGLPQLDDVVDKLPIPYGYSEISGIRHPSVSTQTSVFFAVNPSLVNTR
jgi:hypothetical protein